MKRLVSLLLVGMLMLPCVSSLAEDFTLHSGTKFGMTLEEIKEIETKAGYEVEETVVALSANTDDSTCLKLEAPELAGIGGNVYYDFSLETGECNVCFYWLEPDTQMQVENLIQAYCDKYGTPVSKGDVFLDIPGDAHNAIEQVAGSKAIYELFDEPVTVGSLYQWLIYQDNGSAVDILIVPYEYGGKHISLHNIVVVSYSLRTAEEMQTVADEAEKIQNAREADI